MTTKSSTREEQLSSLVLDYTIYPRTIVDTHHIARLTEAKRAGAEFPPLVADSKTRRVVDGFHRLKAHIQVDGVDAVAPVEWRTYPDEAALFVDAVALNAHHGLRISRLDEAHCMQVAQDLGVAPDKIAAVLTLTLEKLEDLRAQRFATSPDGKPVLLKRSNRHLAGQKLSAKQVKGNSRASGMPLGFHVDQVINVLESGTADSSDTAVLDRLRHLVDLLNAFLGDVGDIADAG